jgi:predicted kinase
VLERAGAIRVRSDVERKRLFGLRALDESAARVPGGIYTGEATGRTYSRLVELAGLALDAGFPVIVDAAFLRAAERDRFRELARQRGCPFTILHCRADPAVLAQRVRARLAGALDPSEADLSVLDRQLAGCEPLVPEERALAIELDTGSEAIDREAAGESIVERWLGAR